MACLKRFELLTHGLEGRCSIQLSYRHKIIFLVSHTGIEPVTPWLKVMCSTDWANGSYGAGDEGRTRDIQLGRLTLYQLSYSRIYDFTNILTMCLLVAEAGFEPTTFGLWARRATGLLYPALTYKIIKIIEWCLGPDLNRHGIKYHRILSPVRLPISPPRHILIFLKTYIDKVDYTFFYNVCQALLLFFFVIFFYSYLLVDFFINFRKI